MATSNSPYTGPTPSIVPERTSWRHRAPAGAPAGQAPNAKSPASVAWSGLPRTGSACAAATAGTARAGRAAASTAAAVRRPRRGRRGRAVTRGSLSWDPEARVSTPPRAAAFPRIHDPADRRRGGYLALVERPPEIRASDAERERTAALLRDAAAEGRLTFEELADRVEA